MAYGSGTARRRTFKSRGVTRAIKASTSAKKRFKKIASARRAPNKWKNSRSALSNARGVRSNTRAIKRLRQQLWGPIQSQTTYFGIATGCHILTDHPLVFHVNNPGHGAQGPQVYLTNYGTVGANQTGLAKVGNGFDIRTPHQKDGTLNVGTHEDSGDQPNGPALKLLSVHYDFKFSGFADNTNVRIDVVRQKRGQPTSPWQTIAMHPSHLYLPETAHTFKGIAGFSQHFIDRKQYDVLMTKRLFFNSRGSSNVQDDLSGTNTVDATTKPIQMASLHLKLNKILRQITSSVQEADFIRDDTDMNASTITQDSGGYSYDNQNPFQNIFVIISSDDKTDVGSVVTGDSISMEVFRRCHWQDKVA